jgi:putative oxidoreductase
MTQAGTFKNIIKNSHIFLVRFGEFLQPLVLLVFRLYWGWRFFKTGLGKLGDHASTTEFFSSLGIPMPGLNAWFIGGLECVGGLLLLVGLFARPIALLMVGNMIVAYLSVADDRATVVNIFRVIGWHLGIGTCAPIGDNECPIGLPAVVDPFLQATPFFFLLMSVLVLAFGPGAISLDYLFYRKLCESCEKGECCK